MTILAALLKRARRSAMVLTLAGLSALAAPLPSLAQGRAERPPFPVLTLPESGANGQRAIDLLGDRLPEVAAFYGKSADQLRQMLLTDRKLKVDRRGRLFFEDELEAPLPAASAAPARSAQAPLATPLANLTPAQTTALNGTLLPLDQTFLLHSRPGAKRTIYLNFKGATLTNTAWNSSASTINAPAFDLDGIPGSFNTAELQAIQGIWQRVAEDYAPFDVDITTEAPSADRISRSGSTDDVYGTVALITTRAGVYSCSCGGVAYLGVFDDTSEFYKPALVFYDALGSGNEKYVAEAISHEVGHNGGLSHDGYSGGGYYQGQGTGTTGWAPIMGVGYYKNLVQWSKGEYSTANNGEDDFAVMGNNGLPRRADDHGNTLAAATVLAGTSSGGLVNFAEAGVIESAADVDVFAFSASAGAITITLAPAARSANLDAQLQLLDSAGNVLATVNPVDALNATLTYTLPLSGTYYLAVRGVGKGDPLVDGYSNYGSVGQYLLSGQVPSPGSAAPVAVISANPTSGTVPLVVSFSAAGSTDADGSIASYSWNFGNGSTASGPTASTTYSTAGSYTAQLTVVDNSGLQSTKSVTITANAPVVTAAMHVSNIAMALTVQKNGMARASATVTVVNANGVAVPGATVTGNWSGLVSGSASGTTGTAGGVTFTSPNTRGTGGFITFTVTGVTLAGYQYAPASNIETSDAISR